MGELLLPGKHDEVSILIAGGCHCSEIRYETKSPVFRLTHCHCSICRAFGGTLMSWITVDRSYFRVTEGTPKPYQSSANGQRDFCGNCGAHLTFSDSCEPETIDIAIGSLDRPEYFAPDNQIWASERLPFLRDINSLPTSLEQATTSSQYRQSSTGASHGVSRHIDGEHNEAGLADIDIRDSRDIPFIQIVDLYKANHWSSAEKPDQLCRGLMNSSTLISAWRGNKLLGLANAITDGHLVVYYPHLLVHPDCQGEGVGHLIMKEMLTRYGHLHQQILTADSSAANFYLKCGFVQAGQTIPMWIYDGDEH